jgi:hypothetical protein
MKRLLCSLGVVCLSVAYITMIILLPEIVAYFVIGGMLVIGVFSYVYFGLFKDM